MQYLLAFADFFHLPHSGQLSTHYPFFMEELRMALVLTNHWFCFMNSLLNKHNYNCKYCSTKSTLQNLHEYVVISIFMNEIAFHFNYNCNYCSTMPTLQNLHENFITSLWMKLLLNITIIVSIVQQNQRNTTI